LSDTAFQPTDYTDKKDIVIETINIVNSAHINAIANTTKDKIMISSPLHVKQCNFDSYINPSKEFVCICNECSTTDGVSIGSYMLFIEKESLRNLLLKINDSKILICDDTAFMRYMIKDILNKNGNYIFFDEAKDGEEAVRKYIKIRPDLVIMDTALPVCDGITATTEIMKLDPDAKIIVSSTNAFQVEIIRAIKAGAKDFLLKPYDINRVLESINKLSESKKKKTKDTKKII
jgi:two-component system, chemotaxis family, chemotaxis protein CheY